MDAPLRSIFAATLLGLVSGCTTPEPKPSAVRPQMPADTPPLQPKPMTSLPPIQGLPVLPSSVTPAAPMSPSTPTVQTGYSVSDPAKPGSIKSQVPLGETRVKIVAFVGASNIVTDEEVWEATKQRLPEYARQEGGDIVEDLLKKKAIYKEELAHAIERELILDEMYIKLKKVKKESVIEEIKDYAGKSADRRLREMKRGKSDERFQMELLGRGLTAPVLRRQMERQLMAEEFVRSMLREKNKGFSLSDVRGYFDTHPDEFGVPDRVKWLDIFINFNKFSTKREAYDYALAIQLHAAAGEDFVKLSRTYDQGLAGQAGGVGPGSERGKILPLEVESTVWALKAGQVSNLVETPAGYHIVKVAERDYAGVKLFDDQVQKEARAKLLHNLQEVEYKRLVESLWRAGVVKIVEMP